MSLIYGLMVSSLEPWHGQAMDIVSLVSINRMSFLLGSWSFSCMDAVEFSCTS